MEKIIVINAGSSTVKFQVFDNATDESLVSGIVDRIGIDGSYVQIKVGNEKYKQESKIIKHEEGIKIALDMLLEHKVLNSLDEIIKAGHRVVQGGDYFKEAVLVGQTELDKIIDYAELSPLHNIPNSEGIKVIQNLLPNVKNIAVFDTEFHQTMPEESYLYGVPMSWYKEHKVRRYGAHGTSHKYVSNEVANLRKVDVKDQKVIVCHLGNGASLSAVDGGKCIQTSMGLTPLDGVIMGTRSGVIDPSIINFMCERTGKTVAQITHDLNHESGIKGLSEVSSDFRDIEEAVANGNEQAMLALNVYITRLVEYIGSYYFRLGGVDAIAFTAGIGENDRGIRKEVVNRLAFLGVKLDEEANQSNKTFINKDDSGIDVMIVPTDEEYQILQETKRF